MEQTVIVVAFNGTADAGARNELAGFDAKVRARFPEREVRWALTSPWMIQNLNKLEIAAVDMYGNENSQEPYTLTFIFTPPAPDTQHLPIPRATTAA